MPDLLDRTARQVRLPGGIVHALRKADSNSLGGGRRYWTACGRMLTAAEGAVLTTHEVFCSCCERMTS